MVDVTDAVLAVLTRAPRHGGKTRLFAGLGRPPDPALLEALLLDTIEGATPDGVRVVVAVTPDAACDEIRTLLSRLKPAPTNVERLKPAPTNVEPAPANVLVMPQVDGDLGERMRAVMASLFKQGARAVALIGSDLPHLPASTVATAFDMLAADRDTLVLGPATDGGYYLVAATRVPAIFSGIEWGTARVLAQTERAAVTCGLHVQRLPALDDVDTADDLRRVVQRSAVPRTAAWLRATGRLGM